MPRFLAEEGKGALTAAIRDIEAQTSAEIVIAVRAASGPYLHADLFVGFAAAFGVLLFMIASPWPFDLVGLVIEPVLAGAAIGFAASRLPPLRRWLTPARIRRRWVERAAKATFVDKGVSLTRDRTGVLVYVSLLERVVAVVADDGVVRAVDAVTWQEHADRLDACVRRGGDGKALAAAMLELGPALSPVLPRGDDDVNELADEVCG